MSISTAELANHLGLDCTGQTSTKLNSVAALSEAGLNQLTFLSAGKRLTSDVYQTNAVVITTHELAEHINATALIISRDPQLSFAKAITLVFPVETVVTDIHSTAIIDNSVQLGEGVQIAANAVIESGVKLGNNISVGANTFIGTNSQIGNDSRLDANVTIYPNTIIGQDCQLSSGCVVGAAGFGILPEKGEWVRFPQLGKVIIGDHVDIGANTCIDRGALDDTIIGNGVKLDNLIQIAHNVVIEENTVIAACTGIAGSAHIGKNCRIGGRASIQGHISIADQSVIATCSFVNKSITKPGVYSSSLAAQDNKRWLKNHARLHRLDSLAKQVKNIELNINSIIKNGDKQ